MILAFLSCILSRNSICFVLCVWMWVVVVGLFMLKDVEHKPLYLISSRNWPTTSTLLAPGLLGAGHEQCIYVQEGNIYV